jgi:hypothetical protein
MAVVDLGGTPRGVLDDIGRCRPADHGSLVLVLDPQRHEGVARLARELGASLVISGFCPPPRALAVLERWCRVCLARREHAGWLGETASETEW